MRIRAPQLGLESHVMRSRPGLPPAPGYLEVDSPGANPLPDDWQFDHGIADFPKLPIDVHPIPHYGKIVTRLATLEDGSVYRVHDGIPHLRKLAMEQVDLETPAYGIRDDVGFMRHHQIRKVEAGRRIIVVSRELETEEEVTQPRTAYNMLLIARDIMHSDGTVDDHNLETSGISRGGMHAIVAKPIAEHTPELDLKVFDFEAIVPCFAEALRLRLEYLKMPFSEAASLLYHAAKLPAPVLIHYPQSVDTDPRAAKRGFIALTNGDAGRAVGFMSKNPKDTHGYVRGYPDDVMGQGHLWDRKFAPHDGVVVDISRCGLFPFLNGHLRVISREDLDASLRRQDRMCEEAKNHNGRIDAIDYSYVNGLAA